MVGRVWLRHGHRGRPLDSVVSHHRGIPMSWDIFVQDLPEGVTTIDDIPKDFAPQPLGPRSTIISKILEVVPSADFSDPAWGQIDGENWSIEVNLGASELCHSFAFHVRGGDEAAGVVAAVLEHLHLRALDPGGEGGIFSAGPGSVESFRRWRAYRDKAVGA